MSEEITRRRPPEEEVVEPVSVPEEEVDTLASKVTSISVPEEEVGQSPKGPSTSPPEYQQQIRLHRPKNLKRKSKRPALLRSSDPERLVELFAHMPTETIDKASSAAINVAERTDPALATIRNEALHRRLGLYLSALMSFFSLSGVIILPIYVPTIPIGIFLFLCTFVAISFGSFVALASGHSISLENFVKGFQSIAESVRGTFKPSRNRRDEEDSDDEGS